MPGKKSLTGVSTLTYYKKLMPMLYFNDPLGIWSFCKKTGQFFLGLFKPTIREVGGSDVRIVVQKSAALAAQTFMLGMAAEGQDTCPMEGYDSVRLKRILKLPRRAAINMVIGCGKRQPDGVYGPRLRVPDEAVIFTL
jgi:nitroreductase